MVREFQGGGDDVIGFGRCVAIRWAHIRSNEGGLIGLRRCREKQIALQVAFTMEIKAQLAERE